MEPLARRAGRHRSATGVALNYRRSGTGPVGRTPHEWESVESTAVVGRGIELFDRVATGLQSFRIHGLAGVRVDADPTGTDALIVRDGPLRGYCRVVERIDESLRQGMALGTGVGNAEVAEHRCVLELDPTSGEISAQARTSWLAGTDFLLPGGVDRQRHAHRRMVRRVVRALAREGGRAT